jgi:uncharacterized protein
MTLPDPSESMLFNVSSLLREPVGSSRRYTLEPEAPVRSGHVELIRVPRGVLVRTTADVDYAAECSRCLEPFVAPVHVEFEEVFFQQVDVVTGRRLEDEDEERDPDAFLIGTDHSIDIREAVRQYTEMAAAMQPLCRADCPGLCPQCGQDLSVTTCDCDRAPADVRWAALAALKFPSNG